jgi:hypothetical protein
MVTRITTHRTGYDSASKTLGPHNWQSQLQTWIKNYSSLSQLHLSTSGERLADLRIGERTGERVNISAVTDTVEMECEDLPLPLAYAGDKRVKRFHFSEIIGRLSYVRATVTWSLRVTSRLKVARYLSLLRMMSTNTKWRRSGTRSEPSVATPLTVRNMAYYCSPSAKPPPL